jgi:PAS domain S-box-containing protein
MANKRSKGSREETKFILNLLTDPVAIVDQNGLLMLVNDAFGKATGLDSKELIGTHFMDLPVISSETKKLLMEKWIKTMQGVPSVPYEVPFVTPTGEKHTVEMKASKIDFNGQPADLVILRDVTRRKEDAKRLEEYAKIMEALVEEKIKETKESEEKFRAISASAMDAIILMDDATEIVYWNPAATRIFGYTEKEAIGKNLEKLLFPPRLHGIHSKTAQVFSARKWQLQGKTIKSTLFSKNGTEIPIELSASTVELKNKRYLLGIVRDISERKHIEEELRQTEQKLRSVVYGSPIPAFFIGKDHKVVYWNEALEKYSGLKAEDIVGTEQHWKPFYSQKRPCMADLIVDEAADQIPQWYSGKFQKSELVEGGYEATDFFPAVGKNGAWLHFTAVAIRDTKGSMIGAMEVLEDITERKKAEEALRMSEETYRALINGMNDTAWVIDLDGKFVDVNAAAVKVLGYSREELLTMGPTDIDSSLSKKQIKDLVKRMPADQIQVFETSHTTKDGKKIPVEISSSLVTYKGKKAILSIARDITERVKMQKKLEKYSRRLEETVEKRTKELKEANDKLLKAERLAAIGELAGMVGHDLRNPLTGIKNAAYYLKTKRRSSFDANGKKMLEIIDSAVTRADKIIGDLQEYSREMHLDLARCSSRSILKEALTLVQIPSRVKIVDNVPDEPLVRADKTKMVRVFMSIIKNAVDAMPDGGTLKIKSIQVDGNVEISFADTGIGIPKEALSKLFSPLVTTKAQGMGFGLAICKRIVDAHQGQITVQSVEGKGSTFTVIIPIEPKPKDASESAWINLPKSFLLKKKKKQKAKSTK